MQVLQAVLMVQMDAMTMTLPVKRNPTNELFSQKQPQMSLECGYLKI